ncbi:hypothetical protein ACFL54_08110 [Planctomycetota bacterium]
MDDKKKKPDIAIIAIVLAVVVIVCSCIFLYINIPYSRSITFTFVAMGGQKTDIYINGKKFGQTPIELSYEQIQKEFVPELKPSSWPPPGSSGRSISSNSASGNEYLHESTFKKADPENGIDENIFYIQDEYHGKVTLGALRIKVVFPSGRPGIPSGSGSCMRGECLGKKDIITKEIIFSESNNPK